MEELRLKTFLLNAVVMQLQNVRGREDYLQTTTVEKSSNI